MSAGQDNANREAWDRHRDEITRLYRSENKKLTDLMNDMQDRHAFYATRRMYKAKFREWNVRKNVTRPIVTDFLQSWNEFPTHETGPDATSSNTTINQGRLKRYIKRNKISRRTKWPIHLHARQSSPQPGTLLTLPEPWQWQAQFVFNVGQYVQGSFDTPLWTYPNTELLVESSKNQTAEKISLHTFITGIETGCSKFKNGQRRTAGLYWRSAFREVEVLVYGTYHDNLPNILLKLYQLVHEGFPQVAMMLIKHIVNINNSQKEILSPQRSIYALFDCLNLEVLANLDEVVMQRFIDLLECRFGASTYNAHVMRNNLLRRRLLRCDWIDINNCLEDMTTLDGKFGPLNRRPLELLTLHAETSLGRRMHDQVVQSADLLIQRAERIANDEWIKLYFLIKGYYLQGEAQYARGMHVAAEASLRQCFRCLQMFSGMNYALIFDTEKMQVLDLLEQLLIKSSRLAESRCFAAHRLAMIRRVEALDHFATSDSGQQSKFFYMHSERVHSPQEELRSTPLHATTTTSVTS